MNLLIAVLILTLSYVAVRAISLPFLKKMADSEANKLVGFINGLFILITLVTVYSVATIGG